MSIRLILTAWLLSFAGVVPGAADGSGPVSVGVSERFFAALPGSWDGRAIETPVGPMDYAIQFHECETDVTAGVATLSVSDHHWRFWRADHELRLTFLSTFRGNRDPTELVISRIEGDTIWFRAPDLELLTLSVALRDSIIDIHVQHYQQPHVYIRLTRSNEAVSMDSLNKDRAKSCRRLDSRKTANAPAPN